MVQPEQSFATAAVPGPLAVDAGSLETLALAQRVAASAVTVMLTGESGVGKEVYARFIHERSSRARGPFVAVNCAAIPETMLEAVLFGHEKGAFTGAAGAHPGKFEQADGGTLLLDEITEMPLGLQAKLLRALQEREIERLGAAAARAVDVRVIATSNRDLKQAVRDGRLREDLYYRLNVFPLRIPPLRERPGDILPLATALLRRHGATDPRVRLTAAAAASLAAYGWPGNVRELENVMQRALILADDFAIDVDAIVLEDAAQAPGAGVPGAEVSDPDVSGASVSRGDTPGTGSRELGASLQDREDQLILDALRAERGSRKDAAERLGISPRTLRYKLARMRGLGYALP